MTAEDKLKLSVRIVIYTALILLLGFVLMGCGSMSAWQAQNPPQTQPKEQLYQVVQSTNWLATLSIIGIGASVFAFLNGSSKGIHALAACFVVLSLTLMIAEFAWWVAALTLLGAVSLLLYTFFVRKKAFKEVVTAAERLKQTLRGRGEGVLFKSIMDENQSKATKKIIAEEREHIA